jgi:hypothetical protein
MYIKNLKQIQQNIDVVNVMKRPGDTVTGLVTQAF